MKKIIAYVNTMRVHWLVEELQKLGVGEIMVTEYFKVYSQGSRFEFLCSDDLVGSAKALVHKIGTMGHPEDHTIIVEEFQVHTIDRMPIGQRKSILEEGA